MGKTVFFSTSYEDVIEERSTVVRAHWRKSSKSNKDVGFLTPKVWEQAQGSNDASLMRFIDKAIAKSDITVVLIGASSYWDRWVRYGVLRSLVLGKPMIAVHVNHINDVDGRIRSLGLNPLEYLGCRFSKDGLELTLLEHNHSDWYRYKDIPKQKLRAPVAEKLRGRTKKLMGFYDLFEWVKDDGEKNLVSWIKAEFPNDPEEPEEAGSEETVSSTSAEEPVEQPVDNNKELSSEAGTAPKEKAAVEQPAKETVKKKGKKAKGKKKA